MRRRTRAVAANLVADGHAVTVFDQEPARARAIVGAEVAASARELAGPDGGVGVCGSRYLLTDVRDAILRRRGLPPGKLARETPGNGRN